jgi:hypothetical protein
MKAIQIFDQQQLYNVPIPERTDSYCPVPHKSIVERIQEEADKHNLVLTSTLYKGAKEGKQVIGNFNFLGDNSDFRLQVAFRNSYDKSLSFGLCVGNQVFICENGMLSGEIKLKRVHKGSAVSEIDDKIIKSFEIAYEVYNNNIIAAERLANVEVSNKAIEALVGELFLQHSVLNSMQMNVVKEQLFNSRNFKTIWEPGFSAWDAYNAITEALKISHPTTYLQDHIDTHKIIMNEFIGV